MSVVQAIFLGIVQGLTEFLPVSSSGHLVLTERLLGINTPGVTFEVAVHLATLCAVLWVYRGRIGELIVGLVYGRGEAWRYAGLIVLASIPAGLAGVLGRDAFESAFDRPLLAAAMLIVTGAIVYTLRFTGGRGGDPLPDARRSVLVGIAQALAILPGVSRSGATVAMGAWQGVDVVRMAEFSFLMSVPAILGAGLLQFGDLGGQGSVGATALAAGFVAAAAAGIVAIRLFVRMLEARTFHHFAWYCWSVGALYLVSAAFLPALR